MVTEVDVTIALVLQRLEQLESAVAEHRRESQAERKSLETKVDLLMATWRSAGFVGKLIGLLSAIAAGFGGAFSYFRAHP